MNRSLKKIWNVISSILVAVVVLLALLLVGARIVGLQVFTVLSGSMEPTYHTGSLIYVKKVDPYNGMFQNIPLLLSHPCLCAGRFDGYKTPTVDIAPVKLYPYVKKQDANSCI